MDVQLHDYSKCLAADVRKRYIEKISKIDFIDPYLLKPTDLNYDSNVLPQVSYPDIVNYLLFAPSPMTGEQLKCYKSMDAYNYYLSGFVKKLVLNSSRVIDVLCWLQYLTRKNYL